METYLMPNGSELVTQGEVDVQPKIGGQLFPLTVVVAELGEHTAILGLDFMEDHDVTLKVGLGQMILGNERDAVGLVWERPLPFLLGPVKLWRQM